MNFAGDVTVKEFLSGVTTAVSNAPFACASSSTGLTSASPSAAVVVSASVPPPHALKARARNAAVTAAVTLWLVRVNM